MSNLSELPADLPRPTDDGAAAHLEGTPLPDVALAATDGTAVHLGSLRGRVVCYVYPMTGTPGVPLPGGWNEIPGARGCTPQSCAFRDLHGEFAELETTVYGISAQTTQAQREARDRLRLPYELLSDTGLILKEALRLPTFQADGLQLYKRLTIVAQGGRIAKVFYPVFPPDENAADVLAWLRQRTS